MFALVDCNNFYVSCERVFNPKLKNRPVVVLSNNDGCVIARSNEVKSLGIKIGTPVFKCRQLLDPIGGKILSSNYTLYGDMSSRVMSLLEKFSPEIEIYSIDEAFLCLKGFEKLNLEEYAQEIRKFIEKCTGIPLSVGIGPTKTLAKIANNFAKKSSTAKGTCVIKKSNHKDILKLTSVENIWGVGPRYAKLLNRNLIFNAYQFCNLQDSWLRKKMTVMGLRTAYELRGHSCFEIDDIPAARKDIASSRSFGKPVESLKELEQALASYVSQATKRLREQSLAVSTLTVYLTTNRFKSNDAQYSNSITYKLQTATSYTPQLISHATFLLKKIYKKGFRYKKTGVILSNLSNEEERQPGLFECTEKRTENKSLMTAVDEINTRFGRKAITFGSEGIDQEWKMRRNYLSPCYTTCWKDIPLIKI